MKTFLVTGVGAENSLGTKICFALRKHVEDCQIIGITEPGVAPEIGSCQAFFSADLSDIHSLEPLIKTISKAHPIDCLINVAGTNYMEWIQNLDYGNFMDVMAVNFEAPVFITKNLVSTLAARNGTVLNIISMGAHKPFRTSLPYNASKAALKMATHQMARELGEKGITVFGISPNELEGTGMTNDNTAAIPKIRGWSDDEAEEYRKKNASLSTRTNPDTLADFIAYLLSSKERHINLAGVDLYYGD